MFEKHARAKSIFAIPDLRNNKLQKYFNKFKLVWVMTSLSSIHLEVAVSKKYISVKKQHDAFEIHAHFLVVN